MESLKLFLILVLSGSVFADEVGLLPEPCEYNNIECLSKNTQTFLEKTCKGIPQYDIRPIDPLIISSLDYVVDEDMGLVFHFKNLNVTGLKDQKISEFKMDIASKTVLLKTKVDSLNINGDITIELQKQSKWFSGTYSAVASTLGTAQYNYNLIKDDKGVEYFDIGPETITCESVGEPIVTLDAALQRAILTDADTKAQKPKYESERVSNRQKTICKIVETAYIDVVHNIRASAKILPKSAFFKDL